MSISKIKEKSLTSDAVTESNLDTTAFTGQTELSETANDSDILLIYDASSGSLKKILKSNVALQNPTVSSVSPTNVLTGDGTGNATFTITGVRFDATATAKLVTTGGTEVNFDSVTRDSDTQITAVIAISSLSNANEPYDVKVINGNGLANTLTDQINIDATPIFVTASGSLGDSVLVDNAGSFSVNATDPESAGDVTFELQSGSLPPGYSITNTAAEGGTAIISGTDSTTSSTTTFNFVLRAVDAASNTSSRSFSITSRALVSESFTSSSTFSVPSGITSADVLVVAGGGSGSQGASAGGGGGAGGLIFFPSYPVTPGGTITVTVGCGGASSNTNIGNDGSDTVLGSPGDPGLGSGGVLTAKGGGGGGAGCCNQPNTPSNSRPGGSGGGAGRDSGGRPGSPYGGVATQPTQPGNSGSYGFGNPGGGSQASGWSGAGGGGGAGAAGSSGFSQPSPYSDLGGAGGAGKAYTIADGTTSVYYAGGGGGTGSSSSCGWGTGGQGGGGDAPRAYSSGAPSPNSGQSSNPATANKGGGGGGSGQGITSGAGGKGIVIVRY